MSNELPQSTYLPDAEKLATGLATALHTSGLGNGGVTILDRETNPYNSTFPTEIVTCRNGHAPNLRLFIKYGRTMKNATFGHRGNLSYEAKVYRNVLQPLKTSAPAFYGSYTDKGSRVKWLVIEYLPGGKRASWTRDPQAMVATASWIGRFHAANEKRISSPQLRFLHRYSETYYTGWARRTRSFIESQSDQLRARFPWILKICEEFDAMLPNLMKATPTVIHGEYFGSNVVYQHGISHPIDWQSAAIAPGEIDLASLTLAWPKSIVRRLEREYEESRWPNGAPHEFKQSLEVARVYMSLRWLGDTRLMSQWFRSRKRFFIPKDPRRIIAELHAVGQRLGVI